MNDGSRRQLVNDNLRDHSPETSTVTSSALSGSRERESGVFFRFGKLHHKFWMIPKGLLNNTYRWITERVTVSDMLGPTLGLAAATSLIILLLYLLIFVYKPVSVRDVLPHDFISNNEITTDGKPVDGISRWLTEYTRSVIPRNCHSHNDYWRPYPLFSALAAGCASVEADIWLSDNGLDLLIGHDRDSLSSERTLQTMYLDPLLTILDHQDRRGSIMPFEQARGVFNTQPDTTLVLLVDVKTNATETWPLLIKQLEPLRKRQFLTRFEKIETSPGFVSRKGIWPGPITVVGTGLLDRVTFFDQEHRSYADYETYHDTFMDAPLGTLKQENSFRQSTGLLQAPLDQPSRNSSHLWSADDAYYASASFKATIGSVRTGFTQEQRNKLRAQVRAAKQSGLKSRYWDIPGWPIGYRDYIWKVLVEEDVDVLNVDDLESAARLGWTQGYLRDVLWMSLVSTYLFICCIAALLLFNRQLQRKYTHGRDVFDDSSSTERW